MCDNCPATANGPAQAEVPNVGNQVDGTFAWTAGQVLEAATPGSTYWGPASYFAANPEVMLTGRQRDDDQDGYGNKCDADFTPTGALIGSGDLYSYRALTGKAPGPKCPSCPLACEAGALRSCESP